MPPELQWTMLIGAVGYLAVILFLLKKNKLTVRYAVIWILSALVMLLFAAVPYVVYVLRDIFNIVMPVNFVFALLFVFVLILLLSLSVAASERREKEKQLAQKMALLERRVRELEAAAGQAAPTEKEETGKEK